MKNSNSGEDQENREGKPNPFKALKNLPAEVRAIAFCFAVFAGALVPISFAMSWLEVGWFVVAALLFAFSVAVVSILRLRGLKEKYPAGKSKGGG